MFGDAGEAFFGALKLKDIRTSVGAELRLQRRSSTTSRRRCSSASARL